jgi:hypothetical protein
MASTLTFKIAAQLESQGFKDAATAVRDMGKAASEAQGQNDGLVNSMGLLRGGIAAFIGTGVVAFYKELIMAAAEAEETQNRLSDAVKNAGYSWEKTSHYVTQMTTELGKTTRFSNDEVKKALTIMIDRTGDLKGSMNSLNEVMGFAIAKHKSLAEAATMVSGVIAGYPRSLMEVGRAMGLTNTQMENSATVLKILGERYGEVAESEDNFIANTTKLKNKLHDEMENIGKFWMDLSNKIIKAAENISKTISERVGGSEKMFENIQMINAVADKLHISYKKAAESLKAYYEAQEKQGHTAAAAADDGMNKTVKYLDLSKDQLKMLADLKLAAASTDDEIFKAKKERADAEQALLKYNLSKQIEFQKLAGADQVKLTKAIEDATNKTKHDAFLERYKMELDLTQKSGIQIGNLIQKQMNGDKEAWRDTTASIIDMIAQQTEATVMSSSISAAAKHLDATAGFDWAGAAAQIGWGVAQVAAIAGLAEAAKSAVGRSSSGGGSSSALSTSSVSGGTSGGGSSSGTTSAPSAAATAPAQSLQVNIYGDHYGDPVFIDRMAQKLSEAVENRNVRLVSKQVVHG